MKKSVLTMAALMALVTIGMAVDTTTAQTATTTTTATAAATASTNWILAIIPVLTPIIVAIIKWGAPKIPTSILPVLCPILGAGLEIVLHYAASVPATGIVGAVLGMSGLWLREFIDQLAKQKA